VKKDIHTANGEEQAKICRKLKKFLSHTMGGYIVRATLRAEVTKGLPFSTPQTPVGDDAVEREVSGRLASHGQGE
jgi:hypothetical protein